MSRALLLALVPVFFVLALGYAAGRWKLADNTRIDSLNALVMVFALPASLFLATATAAREEMISQSPLFVIFGGMMLVVWAISYVFRRSTGISRADAALQALTIAYPNLAGVGLPIVAAVLGPQGLVPIALALAAGSILVTPLTLVIVEMDTKKSAGSSSAQVFTALRRSITKPVVLAPALGIVVSFSGVTIDPVAQASLTLIGHTAAGVALFLTGLILSAQPFHLDAKVISATAMADVIRPLLTVAIVKLVPVAPETAKAAILLAAIPSGFFGILFAVNYDKDSGTAGSMVLASTVFSAVTITAVIGELL